MKSKLGHFKLEKINLEKKTHRYLIEQLAKDSGVLRYISEDFQIFLQSYIIYQTDGLDIGCAYFILDKKDFIGMIGTKPKNRMNDVEVWYVILPEYRTSPYQNMKRNYARYVLQKFTQVLYRVDGVNRLKLVIDDENKASKKVALNSGYIKEDGLISNEYYYGKKKVKSRDCCR